MRRVLITGSRTWTDHEYIFSVLKLELERRGPFILVSGNCPTGADHMAEVAATRLGQEIEKHPAVWEQHGKRAGFVRNAEMVKLGAERCHAFIFEDSKGATMTAKLAEKYGILTIIHRKEAEREN